MRGYPNADEIRNFESWRSEEAALAASLDSDPRGSLNYEEVEGGVCDDAQADGVKEAA